MSFLVKKVFLGYFLKKIDYIYSEIKKMLEQKLSRIA